VRPADVVDGMRNVVLFAGWGLVWCLTAPLHRLWRSVALATLTGMLMSVTVETAQLFSPERHASILDVTTNTAGALAGALAVAVVLRLATGRRASRSFVGIPMFVLALSYGTAAALEILLPGLRQEMLDGAWGGPLSRLRVALEHVGWGWAPPRILLVQVLLLLPAGAFLVATLVEARWSYARAFLLAATAGPALILLLEVARGTSGQPIVPVMALTHAAGFIAGAALTWRFLPGLTTRLRGPARPLALLAAYTLVLLIWRWQPFALNLDPGHILDSFRPQHLLPLQAAAMKMDIFSASVVAIGFLLHVPLGAILAVWPLRRHGPLAHLLPGLWITALVEAGQIFIAGRFFDITDILLGAAGVAAGWILMRRAGFRPYGYLLPQR
jgi:VanZ family protein